LRIVVAVCGILAIENLYRNAPAGRRWHTFPFCIALGALFAYNLFLFCEAVVLKAPDPSLLAARGVVLALMVLPLALTMARNPGWKVNVHVSRDAVFHGATLFGTGIFVLAAAGVAGVIGQFPGEWASVSKIVFFCGSVILLLLVLSTERIRSRLKRIISENFFSARYDYRVEWMRSIATLTAGSGGEPLAARTIRTLADVVDSPGGVLWMENAHGDYVVQQAMNMKADLAAVEPRGSAFLQAFAEGEVVQDLSAKAFDGGKSPPWAQSSAAWLAVPLVKIDQLIGFVVLAPPRAPAALNWESFNLLLTIGQQIAGFLAEERATRALLESRTLIDYSKRFSFVVHDIKNVAGQLGLMVANIQKFGDRAEFRADLIRSLENSVKKLDDLVSRVRPDAPSAEEPAVVDIAHVIDDIIKDLGTARIGVRAHIIAAHAYVRIAPSALHGIVTHLLKNAIEASTEGDGVAVTLRRDLGRVLIEITDTGCGMSADFVRNSLFTPFRSTKQRGHGIGAFQARDMARAAGGDIEVTSELGRGTTMRVALPEYESSSADIFVPKAVPA
jgi:putative PEP-CTERM system histidine kinase